jgi:hypothetical protein
MNNYAWTPGVIRPIMEALQWYGHPNCKFHFSENYINYKNIYILVMIMENKLFGGEIEP